MKVLFVHPSPLMYSELYLRLEPLGLELVAAAARAAGHDVRLLDLQAAKQAELFALIEEFRPQAIGFSLNYLANVPEVLDLAATIRQRHSGTFLFVGGHSASFISAELMEHAAGNLDCIVRGEGEEIVPRLLETWADDPAQIGTLPGIVTAAGPGLPPQKVRQIDALRPARDLLANRKRYFIGALDPCASIEFSRGCPWDCTFCSAWTFYGRSYRQVAPEHAADDLASIRESGVFIVDDVAFIHPEHGDAIAAAVEKRRVRKQYYLETRGDVLLKNREVFARWKRLGLTYLFLGLEAVNEEDLKRFRKRVSLSKNFEALEVARSLGLVVAINIIADTGWTHRQFELIREWALSVPEIVHLTVNTPYPGTETWQTESRRFTTRDYRLFDVQHAVLPTSMPLGDFYRELVMTQQVLNRKHLGWSALSKTFILSAKLLAQGQTNFLRMLWKFNSVYHPDRQLNDHEQPVKYPIRLPDTGGVVDRDALFVLRPNVSSVGS